jgi:OOP family OmpA-OmpF porin
MTVKNFQKLSQMLLSIAFSVFVVTSNAQVSAEHHNKNNTGKDPIHVDGVSHTAKAVRLNATINSPYEEIKPQLTPDGNRLYFSRHFHPSNTNGVNDAEDIWYSDFDPETDIWSSPVRMDESLNNLGPNFINNVSVTGDTIILGNVYGKKGKMHPGLSYSVNAKGRWSAPINIDIQNDYNMSEHSNAFVDLKTGVIIKAVQRGEGFGNRDLYVSFWNGETATEPKNMGNVLNTEFEESSPYLASDDKTLYFASKGHHGHGGYDIYVTKRLDDSWLNWSEPENLGLSINGPLDDEFFSITHCGKFALFSKQVSVHNVDLFKISLDDLWSSEEEELELEIKAYPVKNQLKHKSPTRTTVTATATLASL